MKRKMVLAAVAMFGTCAIAHAQSYFDFDSVPALPDEPSVQVDLNAAMLGFAAAAAGASDPAMAELLSGIEGVRLRAYPMVEDSAAVSAFIDDASGRLESDGWERAVFVRDDAHDVRVYARMEGDTMNGLTIMALAEEGAAFVNVMGRSSAQQLGRLAAAAEAGDVLGGLAAFAPANARAQTRD